MLQGFHERFDTRSHFKGRNCEIYKRNISYFLNSRSSFKLTFVSTLVRYFKMSVASKLFTMHRHFLCRFLYQRCSSIGAPLPNRTESTNIFSLFMCTFNISFATHIQARGGFVNPPPPQDFGHDSKMAAECRHPVFSSFEVLLKNKKFCWKVLRNIILYAKTMI